MHLEAGGAFYYQSTNQVVVRELRDVEAQPGVFLDDATVEVRIYAAAGNSKMPGAPLQGVAWPVAAPYQGAPGHYRAVIPAALQATRGQKIKIELTITHEGLQLCRLFDAEVQ